MLFLERMLNFSMLVNLWIIVGFFFVIEVLFDMDDIWLFFGDCIVFVGGCCGCCFFWGGFFCCCWLGGVLINVEVGILWFGFGDFGVEVLMGWK